MTLLKEFEYDEVHFENHSSQQFATVVFEREEDAAESFVTVICGRTINQFFGTNQYNPSSRRRATCVYAREEWEGGDTIKVCTIQHKGSTLIEVHSVDQDELDYLFGRR